MGIMTLDEDSQGTLMVLVQTVMHKIDSCVSEGKLSPRHRSREHAGSNGSFNGSFASGSGDVDEGHYNEGNSILANELVRIRTV